MPRGYGYGNARLRAMRSRLFRQADYDHLLAKSSLTELIAALNDSRYRDDIETALMQVGQERCILAAVRLNLTRALNQIRGFYAGEAQLLVDVLLRRWDRHNLLAILRGQSREVASGAVLEATVPVGQLDETALRELARQPGLPAALDLLATWQLPYARPLRQVPARTGAFPDLDQLELALNQFHYRAILKQVSGPGVNRRLVREAIQTEIDLTNLRTVLRLVTIPGAVALVKQQYAAASARPLLLEPGGFLPAPRLAELVDSAGSVEAVAQSLADTRYGAALRSGWQRYQAANGHAAMLERELERWQAQTAAAGFSRNPLSMAIPIGYLSSAEVEAANLRLVAQAVALNLDRAAIKPELIILYP